VDPGQANYNPARLAARLEALLRELPAPAAPLPQPKKPTKKPGTAKRLKPQEIDELVAAYRAGTNVYKLGEPFGITRQTVSALLKRHGVRTRWRRLTDEQVDDAARLYEQEWSLARISRNLRTNPTTLRKRPREAMHK
jgi:hypothetical protein